MYFSFDAISRDKIISAFQEYCHSVEERMIIVYDGECLRRDAILPTTLSNENTQIILKRSTASMDALFYIPIQFSITLSSVHSTHAMIQSICDGIYKLVNETVEFSTSSGHSVMYVKLG